MAGRDLAVRNEATGSTTSLTLWSAPVFGKRLTAALAEAERGGREDMIPLIEPDEVEEAKTAICRFEEGCFTPTPRDEISRMMTKLATAYPAARVSEDEAKARIRIYEELLEDLPRDVLSVAFKQAAQSCKFFPTVAEIRQKAQPELTKRRWRLFCLRRLVYKHEREWEPPIAEDERLPPEETQRIIAETMEEVRAARRAKGLDVGSSSPGKEDRRARSKARHKDR